MRHSSEPLAIAPGVLKFGGPMNRNDGRPAARDLLMLGGGHSHALALRMLGMRPIPGVRITLVSDASHAPYSGMLPGFIAGHYTWDEMHIDLRRLCRFAGAAFVGGTVMGIDLEARHVLLNGRPPVRFDVLSINTGSAPNRDGVPGADVHATPAKPVPALIAEWERLCNAAASRREPMRIVIVGGGAGGVELALTMDARLEKLAPGTPRRLTVIHGGERLLPGHNARVRGLLTRELGTRGIEFVVGERVAEVRSGVVECSSGREFQGDHIFWVTHAAPPPWARAAGLRVDDAGFIAVGETLQAIDHEFVFAAGDVATVVSERRPKSGVFAVRAARPLVENLRRYFSEEPLRRWAPQRHFLSLIGTGRGEAVASRRFLACQGQAAWRLKDWIDRRFMRKFEVLPEMPAGERKRSESPEGRASSLSPSASDVLADLERRAQMRCLGCAAKLGQSTLDRVMARVREEFDGAAAPDNATAPANDGGVMIGLSEPDDAAVFKPPSGSAFVQTVDYLPALIDDAHVFGRVAALHGFSDIFAMGAEPHSALVAALVPFAADALREETLFQLLSGVAVELRRMGAVLIGGHSAEGAVTAVALTANGFVDPSRVLRKSGLLPGQALVLTKPLGVGALFAAAMRLEARGAWIDAAVESMLVSNQAAARTMRTFGVTALTDVTGFGLAGHLGEMLRASGTGAKIEPSRIPLLAGASECASRGLLSSLDRDNRSAMATIANAGDLASDPRLALLFDPQTSGGLLGGVPFERAGECVTALRAAGCPNAAVIGEVTEPESSDSLIRLTD